MEGTNYEISRQLEDKGTACCFGLVGHDISAASWVDDALPIPWPILKFL